jgi:hypothetical protein
MFSLVSFPSGKYKTTMAEAQENRAVFLIGKAALTLAGLLAFGLLIRLIFVRDYDHDEIQHAHLAWLVSVGQVPYRDFAVNHFPFLWILVAPLMRVLPESPMTLTILRGMALLLNMVFIGALGTLVGRGLQPKQRIWAIACFGLVVCSPQVLHYLIEFRPDPLGNALLFGALAGLGLGGLKSKATTFVCGVGLGTAALINTKYAPFLLVLGAVALIRFAPSGRRFWPPALVIGMGFSFALFSGAILLHWMHIPLDGAYQMVVAYNAAVEKARPFGFGLAAAVMQNWVWLAYSMAGLYGCAVLYLEQRRQPGFFSIAILCFLVVALVTTTRPWKQYYVPWLLLAAYFPARSLPSFITRFSLPVQAVLALCFLTGVGIGFVKTGVTDPNGVGLPRAIQDRVFVWALQHVPPDGFVVATFPMHPVFRRDTFFKVVVDELGHGLDGFEQFMPQLVQPSCIEHFQRSGYEKELEDHPPTMILMQGKCTPTQVQVLETWLTSRTNIYEPYQIPGTPVIALERKTAHQTWEEKQSGR